MTSRGFGAPVIVEVNGAPHRGAWWHDSYGRLIACGDCDVVTARTRKGDGSIVRAFRLRHTLAAKVPPYRPRHAAPEKGNA